MVALFFVQYAVHQVPTITNIIIISPAPQNCQNQLERTKFGQQWAAYKTSDYVSSLSAALIVINECFPIYFIVRRIECLDTEQKAPWRAIRFLSQFIPLSIHYNLPSIRFDDGGRGRVNHRTHKKWGIEMKIFEFRIAT